MRMREPFSFMLLSNLSNITILPEFWIRCSSVVYGGPGSYQLHTGYNQLCDQMIREKPYCAIEEVWVTCHFSQLHDHIHKPCLSLFLASETIDRVNVLLKHATVPLSLHIRQANINVNLLFCRDNH